jgi:autotransporter-associated beta strand protein
MRTSPSGPVSARPLVSQSIIASPSDSGKMASFLGGQKRHRGTIAGLLAVASLTSGVASAANKYWDPIDPSTGPANGGIGTWSTGGGNGTGLWRSAATGGNRQAHDAIDDAFFTAGSGTVTLNGTIGTNSVTFESGAGAYTISGGTRLELGAGGLTNNSTSLQTISSALRLNGGNRTINTASGNILISGVIDQDAAGRELTKSGNSALTLSANNSYSGTTTVSAGTLFANGSTSATGSGAVSVASGATLGGTGTITPTGGNNISVSGVLAPGASVGSVGTLTFNMTNAGTATMNSGASFAFNLGLAGTDITSVGSSDMIALTGAASGDFVFNGNSIDALGGGSGANGYYKLFDTSFTSATWSGLTFNGTTGLITSGLTITNLASGKTGTLLVGTASNGGALGDIYLSVIPEPSAALLAGLGSCLLFRRRRNRS